MKSSDTAEECCINEGSIWTTLVFARTGVGTKALATEEGGILLLLVMMVASANAANLLEEIVCLLRNRLFRIVVSALLSEGVQRW